MSGRIARRAAALLLAAACGCGRSIPPSERSVVLVTLDTTRADRIGAFGGRAVPTPVLDRIAREGTIAAEATSQVPLTLPSHATILTGRYPSSHGTRHNGIYRLRPEEETLAERLSAAGLATGAFVGAYVLNRGFGTEQGFATYDDVAVDRFEGGRDQIFEAQRTADDVNARVFPWIDAHAGKRFFLWVHYYDPHDPYAPPEKPGRTLAGSGYDREISYVDACLGDLLAKLRAAGVYDRTLLVVAGDHGESLGEHGEKTHGLFLYQGALHVPLLLRAPGSVPAGRVVSGPVELTDVAPTILDYLGLPALPRAQGKSLRPRIEGRDDGRAALAHAETLMPRLEFGWSELSMVRDGRFKYIRAPRPELYDLRADPGERSDLAAVESERVGELAASLDGWIAGTADESADTASRRTLDPDEEARLRSLGYLGGDAVHGAVSRAGTIDPKDGIREVRALDAARDKLAAGDAAGALAGVRELLASNPRNHQARITEILALIELPDLPRAEDAALAALAAVAPEEDARGVLADKARGLLASVFRLEGKNAEAEALYRKLLAHDPMDDGVAVDLVRLLTDTGRLDEADRILGTVLARSPQNGMALAARFWLETRRGDATARAATAAALADARAGDPPTLVEAAKVLAHAGDHAREAACYELVLAQTPRPDPEIVGALGLARMRGGELDAAERAFTTLAEMRPTDPRPVFFLGTIARKRGDAASARARFARSLSLDPTFAKAAEALRELDGAHP
ncbi:MAG TPA: sulfatase-like hydrolase/transferase [Candidatus Polarisedimenticolaceae bacterium]|nr:sulfatase-like hydrolase/transferase [Candidatus Polarisedimenticolaceae bacterium]